MSVLTLMIGIWVLGNCINGNVPRVECGSASGVGVSWSDDSTSPVSCSAPRDGMVIGGRLIGLLTLLTLSPHPYGWSVVPSPVWYAERGV